MACPNPNTAALRRLALPVFALACGCAEPEAPRPDVLVFLVDTLRADHLSTYGYERATPAIDAFARDAVVFERAYSPTTWTRPATASLLAGVMPAQHGAVRLHHRVAERVRFLSQDLQELGYATAAVIGNANVWAKWGFDRGFDQFVELPAQARDAKQAVDAALEILEQRDRAPLFLYVHTIGPHEPYEPPAQFAPEGSGPVIDPIRIDAETPARTIAATVAAYDGEIAYHDAEFGRFVEHLRALDVYDSALIVLLSDHGQEHGEHGGGSHGHTLFEELVRVPLLVKLPGNRHAGRRVGALASLLDVYPTVLAELHLQAPKALKGVPLEQVMRSEDDDRALFFDLELMRRKELRKKRDRSRESVTYVKRAMLSDDYKLIESTSPLPETRLYFLADDPGEQRDLAAQQTERAAEMSGALRRALLSMQEGFRVEIVLPLHSGRGINDVDVRLVTTGRFVELRRFHLEDADEVAVSEDGTVMLLNCSNRVGPGRTGADAEHVTFRLDPPDADVRVETAVIDGAPFPLFLGSGRTPAEEPDRAFQMDTPEILALDLDAAALNQPGVYLTSVPSAVRETIEMDEETREELRALGYLD